MDFLLPMLILLLVAIVGITFWIAWVIFKARYKERLKAAEAATGNLPPFSVTPRDVYLLALDRAPDGTWEIAINGEHYPSLEAVPDEAVRQDVVAGLKEIVNFARSYVQKEQAARKPPSPAAGPSAPPVSPPQPVRAPATRAVATPTPLAPAPAMPESRIPPAEPSATPPAADRLRVFLKDEPTLRRSDAAPAFMPALDLAREIGEIVAEMQVRIPSLAQRSIKLQNAPSGGVHFAIDGIVYPDVNEIPDADIQALIRAATKEWERR
jgi:hypothetical protein